MITVTVDNAALERAVAAKAAEQGKSADQYLQDFTIGSCYAFRDEYKLDRITSSAFIFRFTSAEKDAIATAGKTDPVIAGFLARVDSEPYVWLGSDETIAGMSYVVAQGLLTQARADEILAY